MSKDYIYRPIYIKGVVAGAIIIMAWQIILQYGLDLFYYHEYLDLNSAESLEAGPIKITLSNAAELTTAIKIFFVVLGTYLGIKAINKYT